MVSLKDGDGPVPYALDVEDGRWFGGTMDRSVASGLVRKAAKVKLRAKGMPKGFPVLVDTGVSRYAFRAEDVCDDGSPEE